MILDGKQAAKAVHDKLKAEIDGLTGRAPCLAAILTTDDVASHTYVRRKVAACKDVGITSQVMQIAPKTTEDLLKLIDSLNGDDAVDGILIQLPLPAGIDAMQVLQRVDPKKDVDGFHPINVGKLLLGDTSGFYSCTPLGIKVLLQHYQIEVAKKHVVIVGRSNIVGKPLAALLVQNAEGANATVTVAHSRTANLDDITRSADILVAAVGSAGFIRGSMVKSGVVVVDVGINRVDAPETALGFRLTGDVTFDEVAPIAKAITPVPGGVGPMTIAMLLSNTLKAYISLRQ